VISCDPLYALSKTQIELRIAESFPEVMRQAAENRDLLLWEQIKSLEHLRRIRAEAMNRFLADYGRADGPVRYVAAQLPELPFRSGTFDLALCSHLLFLYSDQLTRRFHDQAAIELCRVASEVRIFPLLTLDSEPSPYVNTVREALIERGYAVSIEAVPYEFQKGANRMMRVSRSRLDGSPHRPRGPVPE
jgi:SAM-dependent methyltransferase